MISFCCPNCGELYCEYIGIIPPYIECRKCKCEITKSWILENFF